MTAKTQRLMLKKLKERVRLLERKSEIAHNQLRHALVKMRKLGRVYKSRLALKVRDMQGKIAEAESKAYTKVANNLEQQMQKRAIQEGKVVNSAISKFEKKFAAQLTKSIKKKAKQVKKPRKVKKLSKPKATKRPSAKKVVRRPRNKMQRSKKAAKQRR